jgi:hypothetical protein
MRHASLRDLKAIYGHFRFHRDVFPHVRQDTLRRRIEAHQCIWQDGVVITYQQYRKRTRVGDVKVPAGAIMLHQILNSNLFNGAGRRVFRQFVDDIVKPSGDLYLSVRKHNMVARRFYERHGMKVAGAVAWKNGTIPGLVYRLALATSQRSDRTHAAAKQPVPIATPMAGARNQ